MPNVDMSLQSGRFWVTSIVSFRDRLLDFFSCWIVFIHVVRERPGGVLHFSEGNNVKIFLASILSGWTERNAVLERQPKGMVAWLSISPHSTHGSTIWFSGSRWTGRKIALKLLLPTSDQICEVLSCKNKFMDKIKKFNDSKKTMSFTVIHLTLLTAPTSDWDTLVWHSHLQ